MTCWHDAAAGGMRRLRSPERAPTIDMICIRRIYSIELFVA